jgi:hypothetical protein
MTDGTGMLQHAVFSVPNYDEGYTTDDNARALIATVELEHVPGLSNMGTEEQLLSTGQELSRKYLAFLWHAFNPKEKRFRNFMAYNRTWLEEVGSEDSHGRTLWALGTVLSRSTDEGLRGMAGRLFDSAIPAALSFTSPRAWAFTILGTEMYLRKYPGDRAVHSTQDTLAHQLIDLYDKNHTEEWPWFEDLVSYCNPAISQALIRYGHASGDEEAVEIGLDSLEWLVQLQQSEHGWIMPIGSMGFYRRNGKIAYFDQQPVEVYSLVSACLDAYRVSKDINWYNTANQAFEWFFGRNALGMPVYDRETGGCRDGLHIDRLNENQGAESTLSFIQSLLELQQFGAETLTQRRNKSQVIPSESVPLLSNHSPLR